MDQQGLPVGNLLLANVPQHLAAAAALCSGTIENLAMRLEHQAMLHLNMRVRGPEEALEAWRQYDLHPPPAWPLAD